MLNDTVRKIIEDANGKPADVSLNCDIDDTPLEQWLRGIENAIEELNNNHIYVKVVVVETDNMGVKSYLNENFEYDFILKEKK